MARKIPPLSEDDKRLWRQVTGRIPKEKPVIDEKDVKASPVSFPELLKEKPSSIKAGKQGAEMDRRQAQRLKKGLLPIEARLDLHGMTQDKAHHALRRFIEASTRADKRCILVITGKGERTGSVLKTNVPRWLMEPSLSKYILSAQTAARQHGGSGALYVLLRRRRV